MMDAGHISVHRITVSFTSGRDNSCSYCVCFGTTSDNAVLTPCCHDFYVLQHRSVLFHGVSVGSSHFIPVYKQIWKYDEISVPWDSPWLIGDRAAGPFWSLSYMAPQWVSSETVPLAPVVGENTLSHEHCSYISCLSCFLHCFIKCTTYAIP